MVGIGFVILFHVLLVYALMSGLAREAVEQIAGPIATKVIEEVRPDVDEPPPPPPPPLEPPPPYVPPPPDFAIAPLPASTAPTTAITQVQTKVAPPPPPAVDVPPRANPRRPNEWAYPPAARRAGEEGVVMLQLYVTEDGRVAEVKVAKSSGFPRLDEAAERDARRWRFLPATRGGEPVAYWLTVPVRYSLTDR